MPILEKQERILLAFSIAGATDREIAKEAGCRKSQVSGNLYFIIRKLGATTLEQATVIAVKNGELTRVKRAKVIPVPSSAEYSILRDLADGQPVVQLYEKYPDYKRLLGQLYATFNVKTRAQLMLIVASWDLI